MTPQIVKIEGNNGAKHALVVSNIVRWEVFHGTTFVYLVNGSAAISGDHDEALTKAFEPRSAAVRGGCRVSQ